MRRDRPSVAALIKSGEHTLILLEARHRLHRFQQLIGRTEQLLDRYDQWQTSRTPRPVCSKSIICTCERRSCPGRTMSTNTYVRKLRQA